MTIHAYLVYVSNIYKLELCQGFERYIQETQEDTTVGVLVDMAIGVKTLPTNLTTTATSAFKQNN